MDENSWGHNRPPKGLPIEDEISIHKVEKRIPANLLLTAGALQSKRTSSAFGYFVICRAYKEPEPLNLVEDLLLQRNFIID